MKETYLSLHNIQRTHNRKMIITSKFVGETEGKSAISCVDIPPLTWMS